MILLLIYITFLLTNMVLKLQLYIRIIFKGDNYGIGFYKYFCTKPSFFFFFVKPLQGLARLLCDNNNIYTRIKDKEYHKSLKSQFIINSLKKFFFFFKIQIKNSSSIPNYKALVRLISVGTSSSAS